MDAAPEDIGILVTNIQNDNSENDIRKFFGKFGTITYVKIIPDKFNDGANICYMKFETEDSAKEAVREADKSNELTSTIRVSLKKIFTKHPGADGDKRPSRNNDDGEKRSYRNNDDGEKRSFRNNDDGEKRSFRNNDDGEKRSYRNNDDGERRSFRNNEDDRDSRTSRQYEDKPRYNKDSPSKDSVISRQSSQLNSGRGRGSIKPEQRSPGTIKETNISNLDIPLHTILTGEAIEITDLNRMLIRPVELTDTTKPEVEEILNKYNENDSKLRNLLDPKVGSFCLAKWEEDGRYYRAKILEVRSDGCIVAFIDEGNAGDLVKNPKEIPDDLSSIPAQFLSCTINSEASTEFVDLILQEIGQNGLTLYACQNSQSSSPCFVSLLFGENEAFNLFKTKTEKDLRKEQLPNVRQLKQYESGTEVKNFHILESPSPKDNVFKIVNTDADSFKPKLKPVSQLPIVGDLVMYKKNDELMHRSEVLTISVVRNKINYILKLIDENREVDGICVDQIYQQIDNNIILPSRVLRCKLLNEGAKLSDKGSIKIEKFNKAENYYSVEFVPEVIQAPQVSKPKTPGKTDIKPAYVSHIENADEFYIQFTESEGPITRLEEELMGYSGEKVQTLDDIHIGDMVVAPFEEILYRAVILEKKSRSVVVLFVDYGNSIETPASTLMHCSSKLSNSPYLAKRCKFSVGTKKDKADHIVSLLTEYSDNMPLNVEIVNDDGKCLTVNLIMDGKSPFNEILRKENCVEESKPVTFITPTKQNGNISPVKKAKDVTPRKRIEIMSDDEMRQRIYDLEDRISRLEKMVAH